MCQVLLNKQLISYFIGSIIIKHYNFSELNQSRSNDLNEQDIVEKSKIAQIGKFNSIDKGNASLFYGGIIFPSDFDYDDTNDRKCAKSKCRNMEYKIRFITDFTVQQTEAFYSHSNGPSRSGTNAILFQGIF